MALIITGATLIDGVADQPRGQQDLWIESGRVKAIGSRRDWPTDTSTKVIDASGKYVIPGLMDANVHLILDMRLENLVRYESRYEDLIAEAAQVALKSGVTTVFDTWGPRKHLIAVRDRIANGEVIGSRIFCAGNIVGLDGPCSADFLGKSAEIASAALVEKINSTWAESVGPDLTWMSPEQVAERLRAYVSSGVDFIKFAGSEHRVPTGPSAFLAFSPQSQEAIVQEAHRAGLTAQAHTQSIEAVRVAAKAGCDIIQHCNVTGPVPLPESTLQLLVERNVASTVFPITKRRYEFFNRQGDIVTSRIFTHASVDTNVRNLIRSGAIILLATDGGVLAAETASDPALGAVYTGEENLFELGQGHFHWFTAMEEFGMPAMDMLKAATRNIAIAYRKAQDLGTLEVGKIGDALILDKNPLQSAANYRSIHAIIKAGEVIDRSALPVHKYLTQPPAPLPESSSLIPRPRRVASLPSCC